MRRTTRSIIAGVATAAVLAWGGISVAMSPSGSSALECDAALQAVADAALRAVAATTETARATSTAATEDPTPPTSDPSSGPTSDPTSDPTATPTCGPPGSPPAEPTAGPSAPPSEPAPPPRPVPPAPTCSEPPTEAEIRAVYDGWNVALANSADRVAERYTTDATLLSTLKDKVFNGREAIHGYFVPFVKRLPQAELGERTIKILGQNAAVDTGLYTFKFGDGLEPKTIPARFTFVYKVVDRKCLIISHHSSAMPEAKK